jgi:hypothetical protein
MLHRYFDCSILKTSSGFGHLVDQVDGYLVRSAAALVPALHRHDEARFGSGIALHEKNIEQVSTAALAPQYAVPGRTVPGWWRPDRLDRFWAGRFWSDRF